MLRPLLFGLLAELAFSQCPKGHTQQRSLGQAPQKASPQRITPGQSPSPGATLYTQGVVPGRVLPAMLRGSQSSLPASAMTCAGCHGPHGEGRTEGGVTVPAINHTWLEGDLRNAVVGGLGRNGEPLHPAMPSYPLNTAEVSSLAAYLTSLAEGRFGTSGVGPQVVRLGMALLPSLPAGKSIRNAVAAEFARINAGGGIYGRRLELTIAPTNAALQGAVLALVATTDQTSAPVGLPSIGPTFNAKAQLGTYTLLPSIGDQFLTLAEYARAQHLRRIYWVRSNSPFDRDASAAWEGAIASHTIERATAPAEADALFFTGTPEDLQRLLDTDAASRLPVLTLHLIAGPAVFNLKEDQRHRLLLSYPGLLPPASPRADATGYLASRSLATAAAQVAIEALKRSGRDLSRESFCEALESLHDFPTTLAGRVTFGPRQFAGVRGSFIVTPRMNGYEPVSDWLDLKE